MKRIWLFLYPLYPLHVTAFQAPTFGLGAVLFPVRGRVIQGISNEPWENQRTALQDAGDFFVGAFWTAKVGGGARELTKMQRESLQQSQFAEFNQRYGGRGQRKAELLVCRNAQDEIVACAGIEVDAIPEGSLKGPVIKRAPLMSNVAVSRQYRRRGLAEELVDLLEDLCAEWGYDECYLYVEQRNVAAVRLYEKLGYKKLWKDDTAQTLLPTESGSLRNGPTVIWLMRKKLRSSWKNMFATSR